MNFCYLDDVKDTPFIQNTSNNLIYSEDSRAFTTYQSHNDILEIIAKKYNLDLNSNKFRHFIQNNPDIIKKIYQNLLKNQD